MLRKHVLALLSFLLLAALCLAQQPYQPKFAGDPARSDKEAAALGYMRVVLTAEHIYHQRHSVYTTSLAQLVGQGSFTRRMVDTKRGDYTVKFQGNSKGFALWMTPDQPQAELRAFYVNENGNIKAEEDRAAGADSPAVTAARQ